MVEEGVHLHPSPGGQFSGAADKRFVRRLIAQRRITYVKLGKYVRLQRSALDAFIEAGRVASEQGLR
jgi:excisionase family DNA binding protein